MADKMVLQNKGDGSNNISNNTPLTILNEVFMSLEADVYMNWRTKSQSIIELLNSRGFQDMLKKEVKNLVDKYRDRESFLNGFKEKYNHLFNRALRKLDDGSLFDGLKAFREDLQELLRCPTFSNIDIYDLLINKIPESIDKFSDNNTLEYEKIELLRDLMFKNKKETANEPIYFFYDGQYVHNVRDTVNEGLSKQQLEFNNKVKQAVIEKLKEHFKPMEKLLKESYVLEAFRKVDIGLESFMDFFDLSKDLLNTLNIGKYKENYYFRRSQDDWYKSVETKIVEYFSFQCDDESFQRFLEYENLESDKDIFKEYLQSFFTKSSHLSELLDFVDNLRIEIINKADSFKYRKFHSECICLIYDLIWFSIKASIFQSNDLWQRVDELNSNIRNIIDNLDTTIFYPIVSFTFSNEKTKRDNNKIYFELTGISSGMIQKLRQKFDIQGMGNEFYVDKSIIHSVINFLVMASDFQTKGILIRSFKIAVGSQVLNPAFNRIYGKSYLPEEDDIDKNSFIPTDFSCLYYSGKPYYCPNGWRRYSIRVAESSKDFDEKYGNWPVAYHGTASYNLIHILKTGFYEADIVAHGKGWYFSPSIEYCGHPRYAKIIKLKNYYVQTVLQCRINPILFEKNQIIEAQGTLDGARSHDPPLDPNFKDNGSIEWLVLRKNIESLLKNHDLLVIYGIMLRITKEHPKDLECNKWWGNNAV